MEDKVSLRNIPPFMEPVVSLLYSTEHATEARLKQSRPFSLRSVLIFSPHLRPVLRTDLISLNFVNMALRVCDLSSTCYTPSGLVLDLSVDLNLSQHRRYDLKTRTSFFMIC